MPRVLSINNLCALALVLLVICYCHIGVHVFLHVHGKLMLHGYHSRTLSYAADANECYKHHEQYILTHQGHLGILIIIASS